MTFYWPGATITGVTISRLGTNRSYTPTTWVAANADGRLELFVVGVDVAGDQALLNLRQSASGNGWSPWFSHGIPSGSAGLRWSPALVAASDGRLEVFLVGDDLQPGGLGSGGALYQKWQTMPNNGWSDWFCHQTGGPDLFGSPAVARGADGLLQLFALGADGALWHRRQTSAGSNWSLWYSHGCPAGLPLNSAPTVAANVDKRLEVFIVSQQAELWHIEQATPDGVWSRWFSHGTPSGVLFGSDSTPAIAPNADGCLQLFTVGNDGMLWHMSQATISGGWSDWEPDDVPQGVKFQRLRPAIAAGPDGRLQLFVIGNDENLWHKVQTEPNGGWSAWLCREAPSAAGVAGSAAVAADPDGCLELFVAGTDGALWHMWQTTPNGDWSPWFSHGAPSGFALLAALTTS